MRSRIARLGLPIVLVTLVGACAGGPQTQTPAVDTAAVTAAIDSVQKAFVAAVAARDTDAVMSFYTDDASVLAANAPRANGHQAIRSVWAPFLQTPGLDFSMLDHQVTVSQAGELAIDVGAASMKMTDPKGKPMEDVGKFVTVFRKTDAGWKISVDIWNSDAPMPGK